MILFTDFFFKTTPQMIHRSKSRSLSNYLKETEKNLKLEVFVKKKNALLWYDYTTINFSIIL